jgi:hypothetical protein
MKRDASNASIDEAAYREADEAALLAESSKAAAESSAAAETSPRGGHTVATTVYPPEAVSEPMSPKLEPKKPDHKKMMRAGAAACCLLVVLVLIVLLIGQLTEPIFHRMRLAKAACKEETYTVRKGDSLKSIVAEHPEHGTDWLQLCYDNSLSKCEELEEGLELSLQCRNTTALPHPGSGGSSAPLPLQTSDSAAPAPAANASQTASAAPAAVAPASEARPEDTAKRYKALTKSYEAEQAKRPDDANSNASNLPLRPLQASVNAAARKGQPHGVSSALTPPTSHDRQQT